MLNYQQACVARFFIRSFQTTTAVWKQPPHDRQRLKRHQQHPRHTIPFIDEVPSNVLPQKLPKISGDWGSTPEKVKNLRFNDGIRLSSIPTTFEKLEELYHLENNLWFHSLDLPLESPEMLDFSQFITRTRLLDWKFDLPDHQSVLGDYLNHQISEQLLWLTRIPVNVHDQRPEARTARKMQRVMLISSCMEAAYQAMVTSKPDSRLARQINQIDEYARVETFLKRLYPSEVFAPNPNLDEDLYDEVNETVVDDEGCVRYRIRSELAWQLRGPDPLQPFVPMDDPLCYNGTLVQCCYRPEAFDLKPVDCFKFSCLPHTDMQDTSEFARSVAGYWSRNPFWEGDPCEFGLLGVLDTQCAERISNDLRRLALAEETKSQIWTNTGMAGGILTAFAWASAQAYNQGFTLYNELTYPFAVQLLLVDHDHVQLLRYQLNSLTSLWKADDCGAPFNLAWVSPKIKLFELVGTPPQKVEVNPQALSLLTASFSHPTDSDRPSELLRPYLTADIAPRDRATYLTSSDSLSYLIPNSSDSPDLDESGPVTADLPTDHVRMTVAETKALEEARKSARKLPLRMYSPPRPHPNEIFFFKETDQRELLNELRSDVPGFGGPFGSLPEPYNTMVRNWRIDQRNRRPRSRVQQPPRRWR